MADLTPATIKALRQRLVLTQAELAARLGVSTQAVSFWERGTRTPKGLYARAVRALLTPEDLASPSEPVHPALPQAPQ